LLLLPQVLLPRVLLVDEDLDNKASKWFTLDTESGDNSGGNKRGQLDLKFKLEVHNDAPEKFCERFPPILGSGHKIAAFKRLCRPFLDQTQPASCSAGCSSEASINGCQ
jgi:hypothetical protein